MPQETTAPASTHSERKLRLMARHPWYSKMSRAPYWPRLRAVFEGMNEEETKREHLVWGAFEKKSHFDTRVRMSEFSGVFGSIVERIVGAVFGREPEVSYEKADQPAPKRRKNGPDGEVQKPAPKPEKPLSEIEEFADNCDGTGATLAEYIEDQSDEAVAMGTVGVFVDQPKADPAKKAEFEKLPADRRSVDAQKRLGIPRIPRCVKYYAEEIEDWGVDESDRFTWVKLRRVFSKRDSINDDRGLYVQFVTIDRVNVTVCEAKATDAGMRSPRLGMNGLPLLDRPDDIEEPSSDEVTPHNCGRVPFVEIPGKRLGKMRALCPILGSARADIAAFNEDSQQTFSRYLHAIQLLVIKSTKKWKQITKNGASALHLNPDDKESAEYLSTDAAAFEIGMKAVENRKFDAHRQAGVDPVGMLEHGSMEAESGKAKESRFGKGEARHLKRFAQQVENAHWEILEIAARRLAPAPAGIDDQVFEGSVRYRKDFSQEDVAALADLFAMARPWFRSAPEFNRTMLKRLALAMLGDASQKQQRELLAEIDAMLDEELVEPEPVDELELIEANAAAKAKAGAGV